MRKSAGSQKYSICWVFRHFVCVFVFVVVFVIVFVFVFVSSYDFWIAFIISFQNMYGYRGLWSLRAVVLIIFRVSQTDRQTSSNSTYRISPSSRTGRVKSRLLKAKNKNKHLGDLLHFQHTMEMFIRQKRKNSTSIIHVLPSLHEDILKLKNTPPVYSRKPCGRGPLRPI